MDFIKKQSVGVWITLGVFILTLISLIVYGVNVGGAGYFQNMGSGTVVGFGIFAILAVTAVLILSQLKFEGLVGTVINFLKGALLVVIPMLLIICMISFISARAEGLAFIFASNEEILATIQTPQNLASANSAITGFIFFGIAALTAMVGAFFNIAKKD